MVTHYNTHIQNNHTLLTIMHGNTALLTSHPHHKWRHLQDSDIWTPDVRHDTG
jgi:hypothetical protein